MMTRLSLVAAPVALLLSAVHGLAQTAPASGPYHVAQTFQVGGAGGWDYLAVDAEHQRLFVPRSTHTLVLDAATGKTIADIMGQKRNHGVAIAPSAGRGFISDGEEAVVVVFDLKTYRVLGKIKAVKDADGIIYDSASNKVLVVSGDGEVLIPISPEVDPTSGKADPAINLGGEPEFLATDGQGRVFVNLMNKNEVAVVDVKKNVVTAHWPVAPGGSPVGMAIDREHGRLFIGCRNPQKLIVMNATDGRVLADLPIGAGVDAVQYDDGYALASCGDGTLTVVREQASGKFEIVQTLTTARGARTMGLDPGAHALYLPTADFSEASGNAKPKAKPDTFKIIKVSR
jgi:hypothetical protein